MFISKPEEVICPFYVKEVNVDKDNSVFITRSNEPFTNKAIWVKQWVTRWCKIVYLTFLDVDINHSTQPCMFVKQQYVGALH